jgi:hypothetical protein
MRYVSVVMGRKKMKPSKVNLLVLAALSAALACAAVFTPQTLRVIRGQVVEGNLASLWTSDDDRLVIANGVRTSPYDNPVDIEVQVVCGQPDPRSMKLRIESSASTLGLTEYVELFDWTQNRFVEVYRDRIATSDVAQVVDIPGSGRFTGNVGQMRVRYWVDARGPVTAPRWRVSLDELTWDVQF